MPKRLRSIYFAIFLLPEAMWTFISGILLSTSINIATSNIPDSLWDLPICILVSMILMFLSSIFFIILSIYLRPLQDKYKSVDTGIKDKLKTQAWIELLNRNGKSKINLTILFLFAICSLFASIFFL